MWQLIFNLQKVFCSSTVPQCHWNAWISKSLCGCIGLSVFFLTWDDDPAGRRGIWTRDGGSCTFSQVSLFFHIPNRRTGYGGTTLLPPAPGDLQPQSPAHSSSAIPGDTQHFKDAAACGKKRPSSGGTRTVEHIFKNYYRPIILVIISDKCSCVACHWSCNRGRKALVLPKWRPWLRSTGPGLPPTCSARAALANPSQPGWRALPASRNSRAQRGNRGQPPASGLGPHASPRRPARRPPGPALRPLSAGRPRCPLPGGGGLASLAGPAQSAGWRRCEAARGRRRLRLPGTNRKRRGRSGRRGRTGSNLPRRRRDPCRSAPASPESLGEGEEGEAPPPRPGRGQRWGRWRGRCVFCWAEGGGRRARPGCGCPRRVWRFPPAGGTLKVLEGRRSAVAPHGLTLRRRGEQPPAGAAPPVEPPRAAAGVPRAALGAGRRAAPGRAAHGRDGPGAPGRARGCGGAERPQAGRGCRCPGMAGPGAGGAGGSRRRAGERHAWSPLRYSDGLSNTFPLRAPATFFSCFGH